MCSEIPTSRNNKAVSVEPTWPKPVFLMNPHHDAKTQFCLPMDEHYQEETKMDYQLMSVDPNPTVWWLNYLNNKSAAMSHENEMKWFFFFFFFKTENLNLGEDVDLVLQNWYLVSCLSWRISPLGRFDGWDVSILAYDLAWLMGKLDN